MIYSAIFTEKKGKDFTKFFETFNNKSETNKLKIWYVTIYLLKDRCKIKYFSF